MGFFAGKTLSHGKTYFKLITKLRIRLQKMIIEKVMKIYLYREIKLFCQKLDMILIVEADLILVFV
jgi:hypothetical protein